MAGLHRILITDNPSEHGRTGSKCCPSEIDGGQFDDREYSTEVIYHGSNQDSDSEDLCVFRQGQKTSKERSDVQPNQSWRLLQHMLVLKAC